MTNDKLNEYIMSVGGEILSPTNQYEIARFVIKGETGVIYQGKKGISFSNRLAEQVYHNFESNKNIYLGEKKKRTSYSKMKEVLLSRYGRKCFYTGEEMTDEEITVEHLIPLSKGGKNTIDNMVLCRKDINTKLGNISLYDKIRCRDALRRRLETEKILDGFAKRSKLLFAESTFIGIEAGGVIASIITYFVLPDTIACWLCLIPWVIGFIGDGICKILERKEEEK